MVSLARRLSERVAPRINFRPELSEMTIKTFETKANLVAIPISPRFLKGLARILDTGMLTTDYNITFTSIYESGNQKEGSLKSHKKLAKLLRIYQGPLALSLDKNIRQIQADVAASIITKVCPASLYPLISGDKASAVIRDIGRAGPSYHGNQELSRALQKHLEKQAYASWWAITNDRYEIPKAFFGNDNEARIDLIEKFIKATMLHSRTIDLPKYTFADKPLPVHEIFIGGIANIIDKGVIYPDHPYKDSKYAISIYEEVGREIALKPAEELKRLIMLNARNGNVSELALSKDPATAEAQLEIAVRTMQALCPPFTTSDIINIGAPFKYIKDLALQYLVVGMDTDAVVIETRASQSILRSAMRYGNWELTKDVAEYLLKERIIDLSEVLPA